MFETTYGQKTILHHKNIFRASDFHRAKGHWYGNRIVFGGNHPDDAHAEEGSH